MIEDCEAVPKNTWDINQKKWPCDLEIGRKYVILDPFCSDGMISFLKMKGNRKWTYITTFFLQEKVPEDLANVDVTEFKHLVHSAPLVYDTISYWLFNNSIHFFSRHP